MTDPRERLQTDLARNADQVAQLEADHADLLAAAESSNSDDEHDPDGATLAFEREQLVSLLQRARQTSEDLIAALARIEHDGYGSCEQCGNPIAPERLEARPTARTCIACAR